VTFVDSSECTKADLRGHHRRTKTHFDWVAVSNERDDISKLLLGAVGCDLVVRLVGNNCSKQ